jgi:hypothetical protein
VCNDVIITKTFTGGGLDWSTSWIGKCWLYKYGGKGHFKDSEITWVEVVISGALNKRITVSCEPCTNLGYATEKTIKL